MFFRDDAARRRRLRRGTPTLEGLESRALLAGNVTVQFSRGSASVLGDALDNHVQVDQYGLALGQFQITGLDGTTINGQAAPLVFNLTK
jgi:hypothetical protein